MSLPIYVNSEKLTEGEEGEEEGGGGRGGGEEEEEGGGGGEIFSIITQLSF